MRRHAWLAGYMGNAYSEDEAERFGEFLASHGWICPTVRAGGPDSIMKEDGFLLADEKFEQLLSNFFGG